MRKHLVWILAIAFAAMSVAIALAATSTDNVSTVSMKVTPKKLDKSKYKAAGLAIETTTVVNGDSNPKQPTMFPDPTSDVKLQFDDDIKFSANGLKSKCTQAKLDAATDMAAAKATCKGDLVGQGSGVACASNGTGGCLVGLVNPGETAIPAEVLAFNGKPSGGNLSFLLWTRNDITGETTLPAVLKIGGSRRLRLDAERRRSAARRWRWLPDRVPDHGQARQLRHGPLSRQQSQVGCEGQVHIRGQPRHRRRRPRHRERLVDLHDLVASHRPTRVPERAVPRDRPLSSIWSSRRCAPRFACRYQCSEP